MRKEQYIPDTADPEGGQARARENADETQEECSPANLRDDPPTYMEGMNVR